MKNSQQTIMFNYEKMDAFPLRSGTRQGRLFSLLLFNIILDVLVRTIKQVKEIKASRLEKK